MVNLLFYKSIIFHDTYSDFRMHAFILILSPRDLKKVVVVQNSYNIRLYTNISNTIYCQLTKEK